MKRTRRTKRELEYMTNECRLYLLANKLDAHRAFETMVKDYLTSSQPIPYYIKGIKDFIAVAEQLKAQFNRNHKAEDIKVDPVYKLQQITKEQYIADIKPMFKEQQDKDIKISLVNLWAYIESGTFKGITQQEIRHYKQLNIV